MFFKRNESYRFTFNQSVTGKLTKRETNNQVTTDVHVLDVSSEGAKLYCPNTVDLRQHTTVSLSFELNMTSFQATGIVVWIKQYPRSSELGVHLNTDNAYKESLTKELKQIAKQESRHNNSGT